MFTWMTEKVVKFRFCVQISCIIRFLWTYLADWWPRFRTTSLISAPIWISWNPTRNCVNSVTLSEASDSGVEHVRTKSWRCRMAEYGNQQQTLAWNSVWRVFWHPPEQPAMKWHGYRCALDAVCEDIPLLHHTNCQIFFEFRWAIIDQSCHIHFTCVWWHVQERKVTSTHDTVSECHIPFDLLVVWDFTAAYSSNSNFWPSACQTATNETDGFGVLCEPN